MEPPIPPILSTSKDETIAASRADVVKLAKRLHAIEAALHLCMLERLVLDERITAIEEPGVEPSWFSRLLKRYQPFYRRPEL